MSQQIRSGSGQPQFTIQAPAGADQPLFPGLTPLSPITTSTTDTTASSQIVQVFNNDNLLAKYYEMVRQVLKLPTKPSFVWHRTDLKICFSITQLVLETV